MFHRFFAAVWLACHSSLLSVLLLSLLGVITLISAASLDSTIPNTQANVLSLNISYWQSSDSFPINDGFKYLGYATIQLPSPAGSDHPDEIFLIGGVYCSYVPLKCNVSTDVWKSSDEGNSWSHVTSSFPPRSSVGACLTPESNLLVLGGFNDSMAQQDSYISRDRGVSWTLLGSNQPFSSNSPFCAFDSSGMHLFVWAYGGWYPEYIQLFRATYTGTSITNWVPISTPAVDGQSFEEREGSAILLLPNSNQLLIGGGTATLRPGPGPIDPLLKEILSLTLPNIGNVSAVTRINVTADWPLTVWDNCYFAMDSRQNLYFYAISMDEFPAYGSNLWKATSTTSLDSWVTVDQNSSCSVEFNSQWIGLAVRGVFTSSAGGTDRFVLLGKAMDRPTLLIALDHLNEKSMEIITNEAFTSVSMCPPTPDEPSNNHMKWQIFVIIGVASAVVIAGLTYLCTRCRKPTQLGINAPLLNA